MRIALLLLVACGSPAATPSATRALAGVWSRDLPDGGSERLLLFDSGVFGFVRAGAELPIARAYGMWSFDHDTLSLAVTAVEPTSVRVSLPAKAHVTRRARGFEHAGKQWTLVDAPYGTGEGAPLRACADERSWTYLVARAHL